MTNERLLSYQESIPDASYVMTFFWHNPDPSFRVSGVVIGRCDEDGGWRVGLFRKLEGGLTLVLFTASDMEDALQEFERVAFGMMAQAHFSLGVTNERRICRNGWRLK